MADSFDTRWGTDPLPAPDLGVGQTHSYSEDEFNQKWLGQQQPNSTAQTPTPQFRWSNLPGAVGTWATNLAKTIGGGLTLPGDVYQGNTQVDVNDPNFMGRVGALSGVVGTGMMPMAAAGANALIDPATAALAQKARETYNIPIRGGQISESAPVRWMDATLATKPFSGYGQNISDQQTSFNRALAQTFGESSDKITPEIMASAKARLGQNYEDVAKNTTVQADDALGQDFNRIAADVNQTLAPNERSIIHNQLSNVMDKIKGTGEIDGDTYQSLIRTGSPLDRATKSSDTNVKYYAGQVKDALIGALNRSAPDDMQSLLRTTNSQYKAMKTIEPLVEKSPTGDISPSLLMNAVRNSYSGMAYGHGGDMADLARIGQRFIKQMPSSGTSERLSAMKVLGLGGAGAGEATLAFHDPILAAKLAGIGTAAMGAKALTNALTGSALRSDWYANRLINSALSPNRGGVLNKLSGSDIPYIPPRVLTPGGNGLIPSQSQPLYDPHNFL